MSKLLIVDIGCVLSELENTRNPSIYVFHAKFSIRSIVELMLTTPIDYDFNEIMFYEIERNIPSDIVLDYESISLYLDTVVKLLYEYIADKVAGSLTHPDEDADYLIFKRWLDYNTVLLEI